MMDPPTHYMGDYSNVQPPRKSAQKRNVRVHARGQQHGNYGGSTPLFDDTSTTPQESQGTPQGMPQQFPGMDFMQAPMTNMAFQYGTNVATHGKEYVEKNLDRWISVSRLKYYFAVDTTYVVKKLGLLLFPFTHQNWAVQYNKAEPVPPRYEINAPDLYIPVMSFVTYVLVAGLVMGTQNRFTPEQLGITASYGLVWLFIEIMAILFSLYVFNVQSEVKTLDLIAFCGYKYVGMILSALGGLLFSSLGYYAILVWTSITTAFFLVRTLRLVIMPEAEADSIGRASKRRIYLLLFIALLQPLLMYFLTSHLRPVAKDVEKFTKKMI